MSIELAIPQRRKDLGGFAVGRVLPDIRRRMVGPFVFFDHIGPAHMAAGLTRAADVRPHPHIGLATITYLFAGEIMHRDSIGSEQSIRPGTMNWMTAGRGISHSERFEQARAHGGPMHGIQAWVALPESDEECTPTFAHHESADMPEFTLPDQSGRLIAGCAFGRTAAVEVRSPLCYLEWQLAIGAMFELPGDYSERAAFVVQGRVECDGVAYDSGQMLVFAAARSAALRALQPSRLMVLCGEPVGPRFVEWNFVSSNRQRIEEAKADWREGRFALPIHDQEEFIPLPASPTAPEPLS